MDVLKGLALLSFFVHTSPRVSLPGFTFHV